MIKRLFELTGIILAITLVTIVLYNIVNSLPPVGSSVDEQAIVIFENASCVTCHHTKTVPRFFRDIPAFRRKIEKGNRLFNDGDFIEKIKKEEALNEVSLAKIEQKVIRDASMPPAFYKLTNWGSAITHSKQTILGEWLNQHREKFFHDTIVVERLRFEPVRPIPFTPATSYYKIVLGKTLFNDQRLSADNTVSCASCHQPELGGANNYQYAKGVGNQLGSINTPSILNVAFNRALTWNGRAASIYELINEHITDPQVFGNPSYNDVIQKLSTDSTLITQFELVYGAENDELRTTNYELRITEEAVTNALALFIISLTTPDCRFDNYLKGDENALTQTEIDGYQLFKSNQCVTCHNGILLGGQSYERTGIYSDYFSDRGWTQMHEDSGRFCYTNEEADLYRFKTPGLRNVALTKPYFHDGSCWSLSEAVQIMSKYQTNKTISDNDVTSIVAFLETLSGENSY